VPRAALFLRVSTERQTAGAVALLKLRLPDAWRFGGGVAPALDSADLALDAPARGNVAGEEVGCNSVLPFDIPGQAVV
jgi:hypothetical protein